MRQVQLGQTGLQVSVIAFGTWAFGGDWAPPTSKTARPPSTTQSSSESTSSTRLRCSELAMALKDLSSTPISATPVVAMRVARSPLASR
jgi:aryl-alcohol dehydrogenase-like predicted oxidoreductase